MPADKLDETWRPKRGPVFRAAVWGLLILIGLGVLATAVAGLLW